VQPLRAFLLGTVAIGGIAYVIAAAAALAAAATATSLHAALGPLVLVVVEQRSGETVTTLGAGLVGVALVGGVANLVAALALERRRRDRGPFA
jgi:hypothetical protein